MKFWLKLLVVVVVLGAGGAAAFPYASAYWKARNRLTYRSAKVSRGDIVLVVNSTGTVQPVRRVQVGSFVSGPIEELLVDYNAEGRKNDLLARIDQRIYKANVARDEATCANTKAEVDRMKALLQQAINDEKRAIALQTENPDYISDTEMDKFKFGRLSLEAQLAVAEAQVKQAKGALETSQANLNYTEIRSPVDGIVIDRKIDEGQTVAASFQTPEMFVVAPEMEKRMHVFASVDEADVGLIREAQRRQQKVSFTVDAYPDDLFEGKIYQVRVNPTTTQNVVTYTVVVESGNPQRKLLPGMTAKLSFQIETHQKVLKIPNAALRFYPKPEQVRPEDRELLEGTGDDSASGDEAKVSDANRSAAERAEANQKRNRRHVWVEDGDFLRAIEIVVGLSDSRYTELASGAVEEEEELVTGVKSHGP